MTEYNQAAKGGRAYRSVLSRVQQSVYLQLQPQMSLSKSQADVVAPSLSLRFNGHFPGEPGLASVY